MQKLLARSCPFCGSTQLTIDYTYNHYYTVVKCGGCQTTGPSAEDGVSAVKKWNNHPSQEMVTLAVLEWGEEKRR